MTPAIIALLEEQLSQHPEMLAGSVPESKIRDAEMELQFVFPEEYRAYLLRFGGGLVGAQEIAGVAQAAWASGSHWSVVEVTRRRQDAGWPLAEAGVVVSDDGRGNPIICCADGRLKLPDHDVGDVVDLGTFGPFLGRVLSGEIIFSTD